MDKCPIPEPGSLQEALCRVVYNFREQAEVIKTMLLATPGQDANKKQELFDMYVNAKYPYLAHQKPVEFDIKKAIESAVDKGPMVIDRSK